MKALVAIKRVIDYNVKVRVKSDESAVDLTNVKMAMNPFCEIAVEEAVRLKEQGVVSEVVMVSIGPAKAEEQIRQALALGADRGILVSAEDTLTSLQVAKVLHKLVQDEQPDLVLMGKQAIDSDNNQAGQMLSALSGMPQATFASEVSVSDGFATVKREIDGGLQTIKVGLPAIITADLRLNEPRFTKLPDIMKAKRKPLTKTTVDELGLTLTAGLTTVKVTTPPERQGGGKVASVSELVEKLKTEAKVL